MIWILDTCVKLLDQYNLDTEIGVTNHMCSNYQQTDTPPGQYGCISSEVLNIYIQPQTIFFIG